MHCSNDQSMLDIMSRGDKIKRTSYESFLKRHNIVKNYKHRHLTKNEYPHLDRWSEQLVLRHHRSPSMLVQNINIWQAEAYELAKIITDYSGDWYIITMHPKNQQSVARIHLHIYK